MQLSKAHSSTANFHFDSEARYRGVVSCYWKWKGYGFITPSEPGVVPGDWLFLHWSNIQTDDRYPSLVKGMEVEFGLMKWRDKNQNLSLRAKYVTRPGGVTVAIQEELDSSMKTFVGGQHMRYRGVVKFYNPKTGYGYVTRDDASGLDPEVPKELRLEEQEVNAGGKKLKRFIDGIQVEFGIWRSPKGHYNVYNMTLPGALPITDANLEHRRVIGSELHIGTVTYWNWNQHFGLIRPSNAKGLPQEVHAKLREMQQAAQLRGKTVSAEPLLYFRKADLAKDCNPREGLSVSFKLYIDNKGAGASEVQG